MDRADGRHSQLTTTVEPEIICRLSLVVAQMYASQFRGLSPGMRQTLLFEKLHSGDTPGAVCERVGVSLLLLSPMVTWFKAGLF